ncbi:Rieske (2Fe-2S) protein [Streptomyces sp. NPDC057199]|uniref:Rieske (2Fe-2S) protein n=1 Tax=Streptomyces sp. NPDC057199 TaxID=3346047 RepID=UPI00362A5989
MTEFVRITDESQLPEGVTFTAQHGDQRALLIRLDGEIKAYDGHCPHVRTPLPSGPLVDGTHIECVMHGALFDAASGALEPGHIICAGLTPWLVRTTDGHVEVAIPEREDSAPLPWKPSVAPRR